MLLVFCSLALVEFVEAEDEVLSIRSQWIREAPSGVPTLAAYMNITNVTESPISIISVKSDVAKMTELHEVKMDNDVMQMRKINQFVIESGETIKLQSGGSHVMLMGVETSFNEGDEIEIQFELKDHPWVKVVVPVKKQQ